MSELAYCVPLGIPHSQFLSWPELDQDKAVAFLEHKAAECPGCGTRPEEFEGDREAFVAETRRCIGCELLELEQDGVPEEADTKGVKFFLVPNPVPLAKRAP